MKLRILVLTIIAFIRLRCCSTANTINYLHSFFTFYPGGKWSTKLYPITKPLSPKTTGRCRGVGCASCSTGTPSLRPTRAYSPSTRPPSAWGARTARSGNSPSGKQAPSGTWRKKICSNKFPVFGSAKNKN